MAKQFRDHIDLSKNEIRNARKQNLAGPPSNPAVGQEYYDTTLGKPRLWNGTEWIDMAGADGTVTGVAGAAPITSTGGTNPEIGITDATPAARGAMTAADKTKLDGVASGATANATDEQLRDRSTHTGSQAISTVTGLQGALDGKLETSLKGANNGLAELDSGGKIPNAQLPALAITSTHIVADIAARDALTVQEGDVAIVQDKGDGEPASYIYDGSDWQKLLTPFTGVSEVTGGTGITSTGGDTPEISITPGEVGTTELGDDQVTEPKLHPDVRAKLNEPGGALKHAETIGDGSATQFVVTHDMGTRDVQVLVYESSSPYAQVEVGVEHTSLDTVTLHFASAPGSGEFRAVVVG